MYILGLKAYDGNQHAKRKCSPWAITMVNIYEMLCFMLEFKIIIWKGDQLINSDKGNGYRD